MNKFGIDLSVIIVSYNTKSILESTLVSLGQAIEKSGLAVEVFIIDNASTDGSVDGSVKKFPRICVIKNDENFGFAKANNQGIRQATGKYILLLNSDTIVSAQALAYMVEYMDDDHSVGVATCKVELANGELDPACHRGFPTPWASLTYFLGLEKLFPKSRLFSQYHLYYLPLHKPHEIDSPSGAFYLVRREVIDQVGLLDEDYFMYAEDLDWSYRIKNAGWKIMFVPEVSITHLKKRSGRKSVDPVTRRCSTEAFYETMKIFYYKHYRHKYPRPFMRLIFGTVNAIKTLKNLYA